MFPVTVKFSRPFRPFRPATPDARGTGLALLAEAFREWAVPKAAMVAALLVALFGSPATQAFVAPAAGSFGYDIYDTVVNQILGGPIGFVGGVFLIVWGATQLMRNWILTISCVIAGTVLIKAPAILTSLGALVD